MADVKLSNIANVVGTYDSIPTTLTSEAVITDLISGLTIVKTADKQNWASGNLTLQLLLLMVQKIHLKHQYLLIL